MGALKRIVGANQSGRAKTGGFIQGPSHCPGMLEPLSGRYQEPFSAKTKLLPISSKEDLGNFIHERTSPSPTIHSWPSVK